VLRYRRNSKAKEQSLDVAHSRSLVGTHHEECGRLCIPSRPFASDWQAASGPTRPFDLVLLLVLSNAVQNSMNAGDNSLIGGLIAAATLVGLNFLVGFATYRNKTVEALIEGRPQVLIHNGKLFQDVMARAKLTHHELNAALRQTGCSCVEEVHSALLEQSVWFRATLLRTRLDSSLNN
jgi:Protein of unknown function (DUF421)